MKMTDTMPIIIVISAVIVNIVIGVINTVEFSALMIRSIIVTVVFGIFGYLVTETIKNAVDCSSINKQAYDSCETTEGMEGNSSGSENNPVLDIKVPPLDDEEFINMDNDSDEGFVEVNPVLMGKYNEDEQD